MNPNHAVPQPRLRQGLLLALLTAALLLLAACAVPVIDPAAISDAVTDAGSGAVGEGAEGEAAEVVLEPQGDEEIFNGIPVGFTAEGYPYRGSLDAPVVMYEYSDFQCPFCQRYFVQTEPAMNESYVRNGTLRVVFRDFPLEGLHPNAPAAHEASLCVADQGAALYWEMHNEVFRTQQEWAQNPDAPAYFASLAETIGADMDGYNSCIEAGEKAALVAAGVAEATELGFSGTPSFRFVNAATDEGFNLVGAQPYDAFAGFVDAIAAGEAPAQAQAESEGGGEIPFWATAEGLVPDPDRPGYTVGGDQYRGNPDADLVVIEFSDFQCPFCQRHAETTQPILDENYVDTDQVMWVFKHFPLNIHAQAPAAGAAAECAAAQGKFWEMKDALFANMGEWGVNDPLPGLQATAEEVGLDMAQYDECMAGEEAAAAVQEDLEAGAQLVRGTPTFILLYNGSGSIIPGALPAERFTEIMEQVLAEIETAKGS